MNWGTPYSKTCPKIVRKFFDDYDLLPTEFKRMLQDQATMPDTDDLKAAWQLAQESGENGVEALKRYLNVFNEETKKADKEKADREREEKRNNKDKKSWDKFNARYRETYYLVKPKRDDKHGRLVSIVSAEQAERMLSTRKENKNVKLASPHWVRTFEKIDSKKKEPDVKYMDNMPNVSITKMMHNAGGKTV